MTSHEYGLNLCSVQLESCVVNGIFCAVAHFCVVPTAYNPDLNIL
jgi:hypothetical protein